MEHFLDQLVSTAINMDGYVVQLEKMLDQDEFGGSVSAAIECAFPFWPHNRGYLSFVDFRKQTGIHVIIHKAKMPTLTISRAEFIYYLEYLFNILQIPKYGNDPLLMYCDDSGIYSILYRVLEEMNCETMDVSQGIYVVQKNAQIEIAREIVGTKYDLDKDLYLYTHVSNQSNLIKKADILCRIYKYIEGIRKQVSGYGFNNLYDDIAKLMGGLDIRHTPSKKEEELLSQMSKEEIVQWYDQLFGMCISLIILVGYADKRKDIKELKAKL